MRSFENFLCALALLALTQTGADAKERLCKFVEWGHSYIKVEESGKVRMYLLEVTGRHWRNSPFGYHAPGHLACENCPPNAIQAVGLYHFVVEGDLKSNPDYKHAINAAERAERRSETFGYPFVNIRPDHLIHIGSRERITLGPLSGYAVAYRLIAKGADDTKTFADKIAQGNRGLLVLSLTDGCVLFDTTLLVGSGDAGSIWEVLDSLLIESTIQEPPGWAAGPNPRGGAGVIVRPRQEDEEPAFLFRPKSPDKR
jgi:hypothetical protein